MTKTDVLEMHDHMQVAAHACDASNIHSQKLISPLIKPPMGIRNSRVPLPVPKSFLVFFKIFIYSFSCMSSVLIGHTKPI